MSRSVEFVPETEDQMRWAEALALEEFYGDSVQLHILERIGSLAMSGDMRGVERYQQIAGKLRVLAQARSRLM